jgi:hypothetical protein
MIKKVCSKCGEEKPLTEFHISKAHKDNHYSSCKTCKRQYKARNRLKINENTRKWYRRNNKSQRDKVNKRLRARYHTDIGYRLLVLLRCRMSALMAREVKSAKTIELIGCSQDHLIKHIEMQFQSGMSWSNHGEWHIDHIIPCASFDLKDPIQQKTCFNWTNLQPLWGIDNIKKSCLLTWMKPPYNLKQGDTNGT